MGRVTRDEHITIQTLRNKKMSLRKIAETVGHSLGTVQKYSKIQASESVFVRQRRSRFDTFKDEIEAMLNKDMGKQSHNVKTAMREIRKAHPELVFKKTAFYDFVKKRCNRTATVRLARIPLEHEPGEAQIDFCEVRYYRQGQRVDGHQFTMSFPFSNVSFVQIFPAENQQCLLEAMRNIFEYIGFVPRSILFDNASTAVLTTGGKGKSAAPTKEYADFAAYYGFEMRFCNPSSGHEKGCVERNNEVKRKDYFTPPPEIGDEIEYNKTLLQRCLDDARQKNHYLKGELEASLFEQDQKAGQSLKKGQFDCRKTIKCHADKCALIQIDLCRYSVSEKHAKTNVIAKVGAFEIEIFEENGTRICTHRRSYKPGSTTINPDSYANALAARPRARIMKSDNEHTGEILNALNKAVSSVRPAAREAAIIQFCDTHREVLMVDFKTRAALLLGVNPYTTDGERYDKKLQSNSSLVQAVAPG